LQKHLKNFAAAIPQKTSLCIVQLHSVPLFVQNGLHTDRIIKNIYYNKASLCEGLIIIRAIRRLICWRNTQEVPLCRTYSNLFIIIITIIALNPNTCNKKLSYRRDSARRSVFQQHIISRVEFTNPVSVYDIIQEKGNVYSYWIYRRIQIQYEQMWVCSYSTVTYVMWYDMHCNQIAVCRWSFC